MALTTRALTSRDKVFDTATKLTRSEAQAWKAAGATAVYRYTFFGPPKPQDLDSVELPMLLEFFTVLVVVHVPYPGWVATATLGSDHTQAAIANCIRAGYVTPSGCNPLALGADFEGVGPGSDAMGYAVSGADSRVQNSYAPDIYTGFQPGLTVANVNALAVAYPTATFWCDFASMAQRPAPSRGFDAHQKPQSTLAGVPVDEDTILHDGVIFGLCDADLYVPVSDAAAGS